MTRTTMRHGLYFKDQKNYKRMLRILQEDGPLSVVGLLQRLPAASRWTVGRWAAFAHSDKAVHIVGWERGRRGPYAPVYALGEGEDKPKPEISPENWRVKASQARAKRRREDPEYVMQEKEQRRARKDRVNRKTVEQIDPLLAVMMGVWSTNQQSEGATE